ncbi:MAG: NAD(P)/FAD-dependent oxidoreductase [Candidatus Heimdallarchaeaceae archaeon]
MVKKILTYIALIGGGPACSTAAIQLLRSGIEILVITERIGGTIRNANLVENLIGFPGGISGEEYVKLLEKQLDISEVPIVKEKVNSVKRVNGSFRISTEGSEILSDILIVGTGSTPSKLDIKGEKEAFSERKLFYEMFNIKSHSSGKDIIVIGSGDVAYDYSLNLSKIASQITIVQRLDKTTSLPILQNRVQEEKRITVLQNHIPKEIEIKKDKIVLITKNEDKSEELIADLIIVAIGREPNIEFLSEELVKEFENPQIESNLYFIGDVKKGNFRQVSIAMGDGMNVAMEIVKKLSFVDDYDGATRQVW